MSGGSSFIKRDGVGRLCSLNGQILIRSRLLVTVVLIAAVMTASCVWCKHISAKSGGRDAVSKQICENKAVTEPAEKEEASKMSFSKDVETVSWHKADSLCVVGRGWTDTEGFYDRLPARAKARVREEVWTLARHSAGISVRFSTDASEIHARWKLINAGLSMPHMPSSGVSGVDLYVKIGREWRRLGIGLPSGVENESVLVKGMPAEERDYILYLPLYNGVSTVEVGINNGATIGPPAQRERDARPVVFYGTSITQGGCASRPGMAYPAIIGRRLDISTINLGFSGNGKCEPEVADLLAELDPVVYVIDCLPNMLPKTVDERIRYLLDTLRRAHPDTPVILVEEVARQPSPLSPEDSVTPKSRFLQKVYSDYASRYNGMLYLVSGTGLLGDDGEATVDGLHPNDLGFSRMADALTPVIAQAIAAKQPKKHILECPAQDSQAPDTHL